MLASACRSARSTPVSAAAPFASSSEASKKRLHTDGAGPCSGPYYTGSWYQCAFEDPAGPHHLAQVLDTEAKQWPPSDSVGARMTAGIGPLALGGYGAPAPQYPSQYLEQQLHSALCDDEHGPLDVWLWLAGALTPETLAKINKTSTEPGGAADYTSLLHAYSSHNKNGTDLCASDAPATEGPRAPRVYQVTAREA